MKRSGTSSGEGGSERRRPAESMTRPSQPPHHHFARDRRVYDQGVHRVGTIYDEVEVVAPPVRLHQCEGFSVRSWRIYLVALDTFQHMWTSEEMYDESSLPRAHDAVRVRDAQRARHVRGEPGRFVSVCFEIHNRHDQGVDFVGTANDNIKVVSPPMGRYSVRIGGSARFPQYLPAFLVAFETINVPAMNVAIRAVLSLCAETHDGPRDGLVHGHVRRCAAHSFHLRGLRSAPRHPSLSFVFSWII